MKILRLLGHRVLVRPQEELTITKGGIQLPDFGAHVTEGLYYEATVLMVGSAPEMAERRPEIKAGAVVLIMKSGFEQLEDGTRIVSVKDVAGVIE